MKLYRFSPIANEESLFETIRHIHQSTHKLCLKAYGEYLPVRGTMVIFCHYENEYEYLGDVLDKLTDKKDSFNGKYYKLREPIEMPKIDDVPTATYHWLYIRKPDPWRGQVGDIDFILHPEKAYTKLKAKLQKAETKNMRLFPRDDLDLIELHDPDIDVLAYFASKSI
jgi:hypothetical protein